MVVPDQIPNTDSKWSKIRKGQNRFVTRPIEEMLNTAQLGRQATLSGDKEEKAETFMSQKLQFLQPSKKGDQNKQRTCFNTTRRCGPLRGPSSSSCGGLRPSAEVFFCPSGKKRSFYVCFGPNLGIFGDQ